MPRRPPYDSAAPPVDTSRRQLLIWLWRLPVVAALAGVGYALYEGYQMIFARPRPDPNPSFTTVSPVEVGPLSRFDAVWDAQEVLVDATPAVIIRLPEPVPGGLSANGQHYAGFSRICTHQGCVVQLNSNLEAIAIAYNHRTDAPALVCNCHFSVFETRQAGRAVSGPALAPLPRVQLELRGEVLYAVGLERG
jgi:arsenite oxidase small subunit